MPMGSDAIVVALKKLPLKVGSFQMMGRWAGKYGMMQSRDAPFLQYRIKERCHAFKLLWVNAEAIVNHKEYRVWSGHSTCLHSLFGRQRLAKTTCLLSQDGPENNQPSRCPYW